MGLGFVLQGLVYQSSNADIKGRGGWILETKVPLVHLQMCSEQRTSAAVPSLVKPSCDKVMLLP